MASADILGSLTTLFQDPNFLQGLGSAGEAFSRGEPAGVALNPTNLIRQIMTQKANAELLKSILGPQGQETTSQTATTPQTTTAPQTVASPPPILLEGQPIPGWLEEAVKKGVTPRGLPGLDAFNVQHTADGATVTMKAPSPQNLATFGTNVPAEAVPATATSTPSIGGERDKYAGFFQALLGQV